MITHHDVSRATFGYVASPSDFLSRALDALVRAETLPVEPFVPAWVRAGAVYARAVRASVADRMTSRTHSPWNELDLEMWSAQETAAAMGQA